MWTCVHTYILKLLHDATIIYVGLTQTEFFSSSNKFSSSFENQILTHSRNISTFLSLALVLRVQWIERMRRKVPISTNCSPNVNATWMKGKEKQDARFVGWSLLSKLIAFALLFPWSLARASRENFLIISAFQTPHSFSSSQAANKTTSSYTFPRWHYPPPTTSFNECATKDTKPPQRHLVWTNTLSTEATF